jgi:asparaginyl-tRNA synthetase
VRKASGGEYAEPTQSSLKKAKKQQKDWRKRRKRRKSSKRGRPLKTTRRKRREKNYWRKARKSCSPKTRVCHRLRGCVVHVVSYASRPTVVKAKISQLAEYRSQCVRVFGWVHRLRDQKGIVFIVLRGAEEAFTNQLKEVRFTKL